MAYYIFPFTIWLVFIVWRNHNGCKTIKTTDFIFALPLVALAVFRGNVGVDTATYTQAIQDIITYGGEQTSGFESGFVILVRLIGTLTSNPLVVVAAITTINAVLFFAAMYIWEEKRYILTTVLIPIFYFDFTMNGLRMGTAFPLAVISIWLFSKKKIVLSILIAAISISIQMTTILLIPMVLMARYRIKISIRGISYVVLIVSIILPIFINFYGGRILLRLLIYSSMLRPTKYAGVLPLIFSGLVALLATWICEKRTRHLWVLFLLIQLLFYQISVYVYYIGLRFQMMALFAQLLALSYWATRPIKKRHLAAFILLCFVALAWTMRAFAYEASDMESPFIPYRFMWED